MNQLKRHKILSNASIIVINISLKMETKVMGLGDGFEILDELYSILIIL
jgi:hypothetical protein